MIRRLMKTCRVGSTWVLMAGCWLSLATTASAQGKRIQPSEKYAYGERMLAGYFRRQVEEIEKETFAEIKSLDDWTSLRDGYRKQLREMLGIEPMPARTPLNPVVTGKQERETYVVENLHFQSLPGLYVTGNLYVPKGLKERAPAILYVCGHSRVKENGVSYGNKTHYQYHGEWFARNGYVCLTIDTLQLGEIEGLHHGTYDHKMWWWHSLGYTPAGVEAWNCVRALDYLETRAEVDPERMGVTGRSGGGAYSWWIAALDDRIKAAVPVAGITSLRNHVVDGCVEGHCDCMYQFNVYRWDYPMIAALVAPRPLLISNTDKDTIFPLDGVVDVYTKTRDIYRLYGAEKSLGLQITAGPHEDTQELMIHSFVWFNRYLKREETPIVMDVKSEFSPKELAVFSSLPADQINTMIQERFVRIPEKHRFPADRADWERMAIEYRENLSRRVFSGWPQNPGPLFLRKLDVQRADGVEIAHYGYTSESGIELPLWVLRSEAAKTKPAQELVVHIADGEFWDAFSTLTGQPSNEKPSETFKKLAGTADTVAVIPPRGIGPTAWDPEERHATQIKRRFSLIGQTLDSVRCWDVRRGIQAIRELEGLSGARIIVSGARDASSWGLMASLFEPDISAVRLQDLSSTHLRGAAYPRVLTVIDVPQEIALLGGKTRIQLHNTEETDWSYVRETANRVGWTEAEFEITGGAAEKAGGK